MLGRMSKFAPERFYLPVNHEPAMEVPQGGSMCLNCIAYTPEGGRHGSCRSPDFFRYYGTMQLPKPPDRFCSDWYTPIPAALRK